MARKSILAALRSAFSAISSNLIQPTGLPGGEQVLSNNISESDQDVK